MYANLSKTIKEFDVSYRKGRAKISDQEFDSLVRNLKRIDPNNSYFHQNKVLPSMGNGNYEEFLETLLQDTRLILTPKLDGCAVGLMYIKGKLVQAITRKGKDKTEALKTIKNIPHKLPFNIDIQIRGELYGHGLKPTKSQALAGGHLRKKIPTGEGLSFCSFEILNSELNKHTQLIQLKKLGFEVPEHKFTNYLSEVDLYRKLWLEGKLFSSYPMDGFVLTVNSRKLQKQLYQYQYAIKC